MQLKRLLRVKNEDGTVNPVFGFIVIVVAIVGIVAFLILNNQRKMAESQMTRIDNLTSYAKGISKVSQEALYRALHNRIEENLDSGEKIPYKGALVREDTYEEEVDEAARAIQSKFIVDIKAVRQSYKVTFVWSKSKDNAIANYYVTFDCLSGDEVIYEGSECKKQEDYFPGDVGSPLGKLPYTKINEETGEAAYNILMNENYLMVNYQACGDATLKAEYEADAREWLKKNNVDLERYILRFVDTCDGDF